MSSRNNFSEDARDYYGQLAGLETESNATTYSVSYAYAATQGFYVNAGLSYTDNPSFTPVQEPALLTSLAFSLSFVGWVTLCKSWKPSCFSSAKKAKWTEYQKRPDLAPQGPADALGLDRDAYLGAWAGVRIRLILHESQQNHRLDPVECVRHGRCHPCCDQRETVYQPR